MHVDRVYVCRLKCSSWLPFVLIAALELFPVAYEKGEALSLVH